MFGQIDVDLVKRRDSIIFKPSLHTVLAWHGDVKVKEQIDGTVKQINIFFIYSVFYLEPLSLVTIIFKKKV